MEVENVVFVDKSTVGEMTLLRVEGIIKLGESAEFLANSLKRILQDEEGHVLIDLSKINYIDSTGIGELVGYLGRFGDHDRKLILVNPSQKIRRLLEIAQLHTIFPTYEDLDAAIAAESV